MTSLPDEWWDSCDCLLWAEPGHPASWKQRDRIGTGNIKGGPSSSAGEEPPEEKDITHPLLELGPDCSHYST